MIAVVAANDPFVMSGWGRFEGVKDKVACHKPSNSSFLTSFLLDFDTF